MQRLSLLLAVEEQDRPLTVEAGIVKTAIEEAVEKEAEAVEATVKIRIRKKTN